MGFGKCAFVKALGRMGYDCARARKVLEHFGAEMPEKSLKIQLYFGRNEKFWGKFGKPAELSEEDKIEVNSYFVPIMTTYAVETKQTLIHQYVRLNRDLFLPTWDPI